MKRTICLYFSMIILFIIACVTGYKTYNDMRIAFLSAAVIAIPSIYSLIPLIKEQNLLRNSQKNRLADSIFTDREEDLLSDIKQAKGNSESLFDYKIINENGRLGVEVFLKSKIINVSGFPFKAFVDDNVNQIVSAHVRMKK